MKVKLGEVCIFQRGQTITKKDIINGDVPVVAGGQTPAYYHNKANREKNIITISSSGYAGYVNFWTVPIFCSDSFTVKPKDDNQFIIRYLYFFLKSRQEYIYSLSRGCGIKHIYSYDIAPFEIELVDIQTQKEIVAVLDKITSLISMRKGQLGKLDILVKSKFIEMFGDPVLNPKGWEKKKLGEVYTIISGTTPDTNEEKYWNGTNLWVTPAELNNELYINTTARKITDDAVKAKSLKVIPRFSVLLSSRAPIGKLAINTEDMYCNQGFKCLTNSKVLHSIYTYFYLLQRVEYIQSLGRGATFKEVSKEIVANIEIPIPPLDLQNQFAEFVEQVEKSKEKIKSSLNQLETLYSALMQEYFG